MEEMIQLILTAAVSIIASVMGSTGFWALMQKKAEKKDEDSHKNSAASKMLRGLGHEKIMERGMSYIERGWVTRSEYEDLLSYLYEPYQELPRTWWEWFCRKNYERGQKTSYSSRWL